MSTSSITMEVSILLCSGFEERTYSVVSFLVFTDSGSLDNRKVFDGSFISEGGVYRCSLLFEFGNNRFNVGSSGRSSAI